MDKKTLEKLLSRQRAITDTARAENRDLTDAEKRAFDELQALIDDAGTTPQSAEPTEPAQRQAEPAANPSVTPEGATAPLVGEPNSREANKDTVSIIEMCRHFGADAADMISRGLSLEQARAEIIERQMKAGEPLQSRVQVVADEEDKLRRAMTDGLLLRAGVSVEKPAEGANRFRTMTLKDAATECMERADSSADYRHMDTERFMSALTRDFYNPEAAFPAIMDEIVKKSYVEGLTKARVSFDRWVRFGTLPNFKKTTNHEYIMSYSGYLEKIPENGELKAYVPTDVVMPERQIETYGRQFTMSRKAFIDDDIGLLTTMPRRYAEMSMRTQNKMVYDILLNNKKIYDNKVLFSTARANTLETGTDITLDAMQKMIYMIGIQKDEAGNQLALQPDLIIVPFGLGVEVEKLLNTPTFYYNGSDSATFVNPYYGKGFEVVEDVFLNSFISDGDPFPWFMGVKNEIIQIDYLNGQREATIRRSERPGTLGFIWDVYFDFGVSMLHPQAICRNPGVVPSLTE